MPAPVRLRQLLLQPTPREDDMNRREIEFDAEGVTLRGWFYQAERTPAPTIVMTHGSRGG
ncbi:hypothetical protein ACFQH9_24950 [Pseudonocardia lutea]|uniref:Alpha/beta hydrolase n=1 Tax=Pseudonocardia lutea TaxID=2172015 RepID=A0ABW1ID01_9PSEU